MGPQPYRYMTVYGANINTINNDKIINNDIIIILQFILVNTK